MIRSPRSSRSLTYPSGSPARGDRVEHRQHAGGRAAVQRAGERADRRRHRRRAVRAGRRGDPRGERRCVQAVLGGRDPVGVERLDVPRVGLAAPADQELRGGVLALVDSGVGHRRLLPARRLRDDRERRGREAREVVSRLLGRRCRRACRGPTSARASRGRPAGRPAPSRSDPAARSSRRAAARVESLVDQQPPDLLERIAADEILDVDAAIAKRRRRPCRAPRSPSRTRQRPRGRA